MMRARIRALCFLAAIGVAGISVMAADEAAKSSGPLSPQEAVEQFELHPDLEIELVAAEPEVIDPVAIAFDDQGRMWVVEMRDYPNGPGEGEPPQSRIRLLEDRDGDGRYETGHTFKDGLLFATGVQPWKGGVIVTLAGRVAYFRDTDGDHKADLEETWFTGFAEENSQLRANHPTFGLDNHIYIANGLRGGTVIAAHREWSKDAEPVSISGMDFRFDPLTGAYEAISGVGQFGLTFDDFGNRFVCSNRNPCKHIVLEDRYLERSPFLAVASTAHDVSPPAEQSRVYSIADAWTTSTLHAGQFTAACGVTIYRGDLLPAEFRGNSFTCEPTGYLVHRDVLRPDGATFTSSYGREGVEFLASRDEWFRPVNLANGPDGALYVVDMYRAVIEHPQFMPSELKQRPDLRHGDNRGRIWRIVPKTKSQRRAPSNVANASTPELVRMLDHPNAWYRETAARLLFERRDRGAVADLIELAGNGTTAEGRVHALWALDGLGGLSTELIKDALRDRHPRIREQALRLAESRLDESPELHTRACELAKSDDDPRVRLQAALALGEGPSGDDTRTALVTAALRGDDWTQIAALSSIGPESTLPVFRQVLRRASDGESDSRRRFLERAAELVGAQHETAPLHSALADLGSSAASESKASLRDQIAALQGLGRGAARRGRALRSGIAKLDDAAQAGLDSILQSAAEAAASASAPVSLRREAIQALRHGGTDAVRNTLAGLARSESNQDLRIIAIEALAADTRADTTAVLMDGFASQTPAVRRALVSAMLANPARTGHLLAEIAAGRIAATEVDPARAAQLQRHRDGSIREQAKRLFASRPEERQQVVEQYRPYLAREADPHAGRAVFAKNCVSCHRVGDLGVNVAPDIADSRTKTPEQLLTDILDPNRAVDANYFSYTVVTTEGKVLTGIISNETASSITLRQPDDKTLTVLRSEIEELRSNGISLMPVGLEKDITPQQMAELVSFIKNWRYLDGRVPIPVGRDAAGKE